MVLCRTARFVLFREEEQINVMLTTVVWTEVFDGKSLRLFVERKDVDAKCEILYIEYVYVIYFHWELKIFDVQSIAYGIDNRCLFF